MDWAPGKLTSCQDDFSGLVWAFRERTSYTEVQFKMFSVPVKTSCPPTENVNETPDYCLLQTATDYTVPAPCSFLRPYTQLYCYKLGSDKRSPSHSSSEVVAAVQGVSHEVHYTLAGEDWSLVLGLSTEPYQLCSEWVPQRHGCRLLCVKSLIWKVEAWVLVNSRVTMEHCSDHTDTYIMRIKIKWQ